MFFINTLIILLLTCGSVRTKGNDKSTDKDKKVFKSTDEIVKQAGFVQVKGGNFESIVLKSQDAWVVVFHTGEIEKRWVKMAERMRKRGVAWVAEMNTGLDPSLGIGDAFEVRVYPHSRNTVKLTQWKKASSPGEAEHLVSGSIPDFPLNVTNREEIEAVIKDCQYIDPSRFPAFVLSVEPSVPSTLRAISWRFQKYFHFAHYINPRPEVLRLFNLGRSYKGVPVLVVLMVYPTPGGAAGSATVKPVLYDVGKFGSLASYSNVMTYMFAINTDLRFYLEGENKGGDSEIARMTDVIEVEKMRYPALFQDGPRNILKPNIAGFGEEFRKLKENADRLNKLPLNKREL